MPIRNGMRSPEPAARPLERDILYALVPYFEPPERWRIPDLARELDEPEISETVAELVRVGLVEGAADDLIWASPAAEYVIELLGPVV